MLPQKPLDEDDEHLLLEKVYVPLRMVERNQMASFAAYRLGEFDTADEVQARARAFEGLAQSQGVFRILSDRDSLPRPTEVPVSDPQLTKCLLLVGEAGSGKTTTLHFGALMLAHDYQNGDSRCARTSLDLHTQERWLPVYMRLTVLTRYLLEKYRQDRSQLTNCSADLVFEWLDSDLPRQHSDILPGLITERVRSGTCLVLFDGLDETGDVSERTFAKELIANLVQRCPGNRYIVASRPFDGVGTGLNGFTERHLSPMNDQEIQKLLRQWFEAVGQSPRRRPRRTVSQELEHLWTRLEASPRLFDMATNPLLLTSIAILDHGDDTLPAERAIIYNRLLSLTISRWRITQLRQDAPPDDPQRALKLFAEESDDDVRLRLQKLAAWMLQNQLREVLLREVQEQLSPVYVTNRGWRDEQCRNYIRLLMGSLALHSGLIQEHDDQRYSFIHFTLQEYLAARHYDEIGDMTALLARCTEPRWRETMLLAVGHWATSGSRDRAKHALGALLDSDESEALLLAAEALDEANARRVVELGAVLQRCVGKLQSSAFDPASCPNPILRNRAAGMLDRLDADNNRPGLDLTHTDYWAERIEPGLFSMGDSNGRYGNERPEFDYQIRQPYTLARFPVTNRQYFGFVEALDGRGLPEALGAAQQLLVLMTQHQQTPNQFRPRFWPGSRYRAGEGNHPVTGVNWYAASAFAWWVNEWLHNLHLLMPDEVVRLPSEAEWERAAAYPLRLVSRQRRTGHREYPWGAWPTTGTPANINESGIGGTSVVGISPHGLAACAAEDLSGNVWEWCSTPMLPYPFTGEVSAETLDTQHGRENSIYVLRGGSWTDLRVKPVVHLAFTVFPSPATISMASVLPVCSPYLNSFLA